MEGRGEGGVRWASAEERRRQGGCLVCGKHKRSGSVRAVQLWLPPSSTTLCALLQGLSIRSI